MSEPVRVGLVGCGRLAERGYVPACALEGAIALVAVADRDEARCAAVAGAVPGYRSAADLLAAEQVEILVLAHGAGAHVADALLAAGHGAHALVEKPPARTAAEADLLVGLEPAAWCGFNRRFESGMAELRESLRAAPPATLELELSILRDAWGARDGSEPVLLDLGPHLVDLALWLTGRRAARVRVASLSRADAQFELDLDGPIARISVSHSRAWRERIVAADEQGRVVARRDRGGLVRRLAGRMRPGAQGALVASLAEQLSCAAAAIRGGAVDERLGTAEEGLAVMRVLDAVTAASPCWSGL